MFKTLMLTAALATAAPMTVLAQAPIGYTGAIVSSTADSVTLKDKDGKVMTVAMVPGWRVVAPRTVPTAALKVGDFIGSANEVVNPTTGRSTEIRIYEPGNTPEWGTHDLGAGPAQMTHGTVSKITATAEGHDLDITYPNGGRRLILPKGVAPVGSFVLALDAAKAGLVVRAVTRKYPDGVWRANRLLLPNE